ncbi:tripartite tricarboxylate transporter permease [Candidatus Woesearchaeota archaeon]|nr:tripartite tricarboxylate transporter permease [Candidatus Woesearchaeota archaeon]
MLLWILTAILAGCFAGIITGLIPGIHINLVSLLLVSVSGYFVGVHPIVLGVFIIAMAVTHTFLDVIPSVFLGAPDADMALAVLPGHKLLMQGKGYEAVKLATIGSLLCLVATVLIIPFLVPLVPKIYAFIQPYIGWILLAVVVFMILKESGFIKKMWGSVVFLMTGVLGIIVLVGLPNLEQPLFPMLSGLFGISLLLISMFNKVTIPKQEISETIELSKGNLAKVVGAGTFSGSLTALFPGLGAAQAAIIGSQIVGKIGEYSFIVMIGGINTVNFTFSLVTLYALEKARNGAVVAVLEILKSIDLTGLVVFLAAALIAGGIATFLAMYLTRGFSKYITKINYQMLCVGVISLIVLLVLYFSSWIGLLVLVVSTFIGMLPSFTGVKKSLAMGCLLLPVILFFIL